MSNETSHCLTYIIQTFHHKDNFESTSNKNRPLYHDPVDFLHFGVIQLISEVRIFYFTRWRNSAWKEVKMCYCKTHVFIRYIYLQVRILPGSPGRSIGRTFRIVFKLPNTKGKLKIATKNKRSTKIEVFLKDC